MHDYCEKSISRWSGEQMSRHVLHFKQQMYHYLIKDWQLGLCPKSLHIYYMVHEVPMMEQKKSMACTLYVLLTIPSQCNVLHFIDVKIILYQSTVMHKDDHTYMIEVYIYCSL